MPRLTFSVALAAVLAMTVAGPAWAGGIRLSKLRGVPASVEVGRQLAPTAQVRLRGAGSRKVRLRAVLVGQGRTVAIGRRRCAG